jgi:MFS family permease
VLLATGWGANQFTPMLLVYRRALGLSTGTVEAMFAFYALGLIPGLLLAGPVSDARGRRVVVLPAAVLSLVASLVLMVGEHSVALLFVGRLLAGVSSGVVFGCATAWLRETSVAPIGTAQPAAAARRAAVAMTVGFGLGPLVAGLLGQWVAADRVVPYLPHIALIAAVLLAARNTPETVARVPGGTRMRLSVPGVGDRRFRTVVAPMAPAVFAAPAIAFALLPSVVGADRLADGIALTAAVTALTALAGVVIQPLARRLDRHASGNRAALAGLFTLAAGLVLGAVTAQTQRAWLLAPCAVVLGCAYGICLVAGLIEVQQIADATGLARLTAAYYALTYVGFAAPFVLALAAHLAPYPVLLLIAAGVALLTALVVSRGAARLSSAAYPRRLNARRS